MKNIMFLLSIVALSVSCLTCSAQKKKNATAPVQPLAATLTLGAEQLDLLVPKLGKKKVGLVVNNTSLVRRTHLADTLRSLGVNVVKVFAPEHGFRGTADAGEKVKDGIDTKSGLPVVSLYGANRKPTAEQIADCDILIFDIQDVGVRFYTYISTLHHVMDACAEMEKKLIVLDRPNPNGSIVDGPTLEPQFRSFLGMHPIPLVHGLTVGELALMVNGEGWLGARKRCELEVIPMKNWKHTDAYSLPVKPSPNLPNDQAVRLYPSIGLFEGTVISVGRGTQMPFQVLGHPDLVSMPFSFTPVSIEGMAKTPLYENKTCNGVDLRNVPPAKKIDLQYLMAMYRAFPDKEKFFNAKNFDTHAGTSTLRNSIIAGETEDQIRASWKKDLDAFHELRNRYLLYPLN